MTTNSTTFIATTTTNKSPTFSIHYFVCSWAEGEPNNFGAVLWFFGDREDCVELREQVGYMWNDAHCTDTKK